MDPKLLETEVGMILDLDPPEIQAPVTPSKSQEGQGLIFLHKMFSHIILKWTSTDHKVH